MARGLALGGFMATGKTSVGRAVAARLGWGFVDTDAVLAARFGPVAHQIRAGEATFRSRERAVVAEVARQAARHGPLVLSTGGGVWADRPSRDLVRRGFHTVVLVAPLPELLRRAGAHGADRPLLDDASGLLAARASAYAEAEAIVHTEGRPVSAVVDTVVAFVRSAAGRRR